MFLDRATDGKIEITSSSGRLGFCAHALYSECGDVPRAGITWTPILQHHPSTHSDSRNGSAYTSIVIQLSSLRNLWPLRSGPLDFGATGCHCSDPGECNRSAIRLCLVRRHEAKPQVRISSVTSKIITGGENNKAGL